MSTSTPLPRSLDPLPGELLADYVMRLAHRLDVAPDIVLRRSGLADYQANTQAITRTALPLELPAPRMNDFQVATRPTAAQARALTLLPLAPRTRPLLRASMSSAPANASPHWTGTFPQQTATAPTASPATGRRCKRTAAAPGGPTGDCPSSSPASTTSASSNTSVPNAGDRLPIALDS